MLLVNFVLVMFWQRDALRRETEKNRIILAGFQALLPANSLISEQSLPAPLTLARLLPNPSLYRIQVYYNKNKYNNKNLMNKPDDVAGQMLNSVVRQAEAADLPVNRHTGSFFNPVGRQKSFVASAQPITRQGKRVGAIGIIRSLDPMYRNLWQAEKTTLAYITINLLVLGVVAFFRMGKLVAGPIDRLVRLADQYGDREDILFALDNNSPGDEFDRLARSLNRMLARIEDDRQKLEESVARLEDVNRELVATRQDAVRAEKLASVGRLAAGLAHEIGNPLGVVQGYIGLLKRKDLSPPEREDFAGRSEKELERINRLIRQLLDLSRVQNSRMEDIALHPLLQELVGMMQFQACMRDVRIITDYTAEHDIIKADPDQIRQVFLNCFLNSGDALSSLTKGPKTMTIRSQCVSSANETGGKQFIEVSITDTGTGIALQDIDNVFDPFFTTKEPGRGTGLGLSVAYSIIEGAGGAMRMESRQGQGTSVFVELPLV